MILLQTVGVLLIAFWLIGCAWLALEIWRAPVRNDW